MLQTEGNPIIMSGNDGFGLGGGLGVLAIIIIAMMFFRGGFFGNNNGNNDNTAALLAAMSAGQNRGYQPQYATQQDVQFTSQFGQLLDGNRDLANNIAGGTAQNVAAVNEVYHNLADTFQDKYSELARDISGLAVSQAQLLANQNQCCCETKMTIADGFAQTNANIAQSRYDAALGMAGINQNIAQNRYEAALNTAAIQKTIVEEAQKNRDDAQKTRELITGNRMIDMQNQINRLERDVALSGIIKFQPNLTYGSVNSPLNGNPGFQPPYPYFPAA